MINNIFYEQIKKYNPNNLVEIKNAMKEVLQDIILSGLGKSNFFKNAVFYGGTSLRIFRGLSRFSEDLDFTMINEEDSFDFDYCLNFAKKELESMMIECDIYVKEKSIVSSVVSRFFKFDLKKLFEMSYVEYKDQIINGEILSIKVEVEKRCFQGGEVELKLLSYPSFVQIKTFSIETLFASKLLAILNRKWKSRVKGRDYYDYLFYIQNKVKVNIVYLCNGLREFGYISNTENYSIEMLKKDLKERFEEIDYESIKRDVAPFVSKNDQLIEAMNKAVFLNSIDYINDDI